MTFSAQALNLLFFFFVGTSILIMLVGAKIFEKRSIEKGKIDMKQAYIPIISLFLSSIGLATAVVGIPILSLALSNNREVQDALAAVFPAILICTSVIFIFFLICFFLIIIPRLKSHLHFKEKMNGFRIKENAKR